MEGLNGRLGALALSGVDPDVLLAESSQRRPQLTMQGRLARPATRHSRYRTLSASNPLSPLRMPPSHPIYCFDTTS